MFKITGTCGRGGNRFLGESIQSHAAVRSQRGLKRGVAHWLVRGMQRADVYPEESLFTNFFFRENVGRSFVLALPACSLYLVTCSLSERRSG